MEIDMGVVPFSRFGSYIVFSHHKASGLGPEAVYLRTVRGSTGWLSRFPQALAYLELLEDGEPVEYRETFSPDLLRLDGGGGSVEICHQDPRTVRVRGGAALRVTFLNQGKFDFIRPAGGTRWHINMASRGVEFMLSLLEGRLELDASWQRIKSERIVLEFQPDDGGAFEFALQEFTSAWHRRDYQSPFSECRRLVRAEFNEWLAATPEVPGEFNETRELAAYLTWAFVVGPHGHLKRYGMFMSKEGMTNVWSWDNCFNAMTLACHSPELALDQLLIFIDNQHPDGAFADSVNDRSLCFNFCKPPVHGWALKWMIKRSKFFRRKTVLRQLYEPLSRWTDWWFAFRDEDGDGLPHYNHGNDSGWDNATVFAKGVPVRSPDLQAFLVIQMEVLSEIARKLGRQSEALAWRTQAEALLNRLIERLWRKDRFVAQLVHSGGFVECESSLLFVPIILGKRLPAKIRKALVAGLTRNGRFLTEHGFASESPKSPLYESDGYWRGPIWAPQTLLLVEGLASLGEEGLARDVALRFCRMCKESGFAENFDAVTGEGYRDKTYTWTASVFLTLAHEYLL